MDATRELSLQRSVEIPEQDFRSLFEALPGLVLAVLPDSPKFTMVAATNAYLIAAGKLRDQVLGYGLFEVFSVPADPVNAATLDNLRVSLERVLATGKPDTMPIQQYNNPRPEESGGYEELFWTPVNSPVLAPDGTAKYILHRIEEVTNVVRLKRVEVEQGLLVKAERVRADQIETELLLRSQELEQVKAINQERQLLKLLAEHSPEFIGIADIDGVPVYANRAAMDLIGARDMDEVRQTPLVEYFIPEERDFVTNVVLPAVYAYGRWQGELNFRHLHTGEVIPVLYDVFRVDDPTTGAPAHFATITRDLRASKRAERQLQDSSARFSMAFDQAPIGMVLTTPDGRIMEVNQAYLDMLGYTREELMLHSSAGFTHPDDVEPTKQFLASLQNGSRSRASIEKRYVRKDGRLLWARASAAMRLADDGRPVQLIAVIEDVTERRQAEEALRKSEERLTFALEAGGAVGTWDWDVQNDRFYCSTQFAELYLVDPNRARVGAPLSEFMRGIHPDDLPRIAEEVRIAVETGGNYAQEYRLIQEDGSVRWVYARGRCHREEAGQPLRFPGVVFDITDRKSVELRDAFLVRLDDATRPLTDPYEITQTAARLLGEHLSVNRCAYADVEPDEDTFNLTGDYNRGVSSIVGRYTFRQFGAECLRLMREGEPYVVEDSESDPRTEEVRESYRLTRIRSVICVSLKKAGRFVAAMAVHQITHRRWRADEVELVQQVASRCWESIERARVARELREREQRFRFLAESIPQMVWTATPDGLLDYVNGQGATYFGVRQEALLGAQWLTGVHPEDQPRTVDRWSRSVATGEPYETAFRLRRASDESWRWHLVRAKPLVDEAGSIVQWFGTCTDIEDQKATEAELTRANRELEEFAYVSSHDLQEPLRMVNIYSHLMLRHVGSDDAVLNQYATFVRQGVARMEGLIRDLLTFSRTVQGDEMPVGPADLSASLAEAQAVLKNRIEESGAIIVTGPLPTLYGDTMQIAHVFQNLLSNSIKYRKPDQALEIQINATQSGDHWIIRVQDNGIGFHPQYAERIFGLFKRLHKDEYPGTGLGLAICQRIVERYGGRIWAEGRPGEGATFCFTLPNAEIA